MLRGSVTRPALGVRLASALGQKRALTADGRRLVLGIESSCDDSCAALVHAPPPYSCPSSSQTAPCSALIAENAILRQDHGITHGIQPLVAAHLHSSNVPMAISQCLSRARASGLIASSPGDLPEEIDAIAVTQGPGMAGCLSVGLNNAKLLSALWNKPIIYVHHMAAHALTPFLTQGEAPSSSNTDVSSTGATSLTKASPPTLRFPFLCLLLSGGHTLLVLVRSVSSFRILATTGDDSIGDAFDKAAKWLQVPTDWNLRSPGAALEKFAAGAEVGATVDELDLEMSIPMRNEAAFSYSGLKTSLRQKMVRAIQLSGQEPSADPPLPESIRRQLARSFQKAAFAQISDKVRMAMAPPVLVKEVKDGSGKVEKERARDRRLDLHGVDARDITHLVVSGGVASNMVLRKSLADTLQRIGRPEVILDFPTPALCMDNAAMIAHAALMDWKPTRDLSASPRAKWSLEDLEGS